MRRSTLLLAAMAVSSFAAPAHAREPVRLVYTRPDGANRCPSEQALRSMVAAQLGYDPFTDEAGTVVSATIERVQGKFRGEVLLERDGTKSGQRMLEPAADCGSLASAIALTVSVAIDTLEAAAKPLPPLPPPSPSPPPAPPAPQADPPPAEAPLPEPPASPSTAALGLSLSPTATFGIAPAVAPGLRAGIGVRWPAFSIGVEGRADLPASAPLSIGGEVSTSVALVALVPCGHLRPLAFCLLGALGSMSGTSTGVAGERTDRATYAALGGRLAVELPLSKTFAVRPEADLTAAVNRPEVQFDGRTIWTAPSVAGTLGLAIVAEMGGKGAF